MGILGADLGVYIGAYFGGLFGAPLVGLLGQGFIWGPFWGARF